MTDNSIGGVVIFILGILVLGIIGLIMWILPNYNVWQQGKSGEAKLREAEYSRQVQIEEAKANLESERLNAEAEIVRAGGAAKSIEIEGGQLTENYIKYLWIRQLSSGEKQLIYVPTEAGLPILETQRLQP